MKTTRLPRYCPSCEGPLSIEKLSCGNCSISLEGDFSLPRLSRLSRDDQRFVELFVVCSGSLKAVAKRLNVSYPTVRKRLDEVMNRLAVQVQADDKLRADLLQDVANGSLSPEDAAAKLSQFE